FRHSDRARFGGTSRSPRPTSSFTPRPADSATTTRSTFFPHTWPTGSGTGDSSRNWPPASHGWLGSPVTSGTSNARCGSPASSSGDGRARRSFSAGRRSRPTTPWDSTRPTTISRPSVRADKRLPQLLRGVLEGEDIPPVPVAGLYVPPADGARFRPDRLPAARTPLPDLDRLGSPYLAGILDAADERMLLLESTRGCVFNCKFCYYPKSYDSQYFLSRDLVLASL